MLVIHGIIAAFVGLIILAALIAGLFMYVGAKLAMVEKATFGRAIMAAIGCSLASWLLTAVFSAVPLLGSCSGFIIGLAASLLVIKFAFETSFGKAFLVWIFHLFAEVVAVFLAVVTFAGALLSFFTLPRV